MTDTTVEAPATPRMKVKYNAQIIPEHEKEFKYSNPKQVSLYVNGEKLREQEGEHIFKFRVKLNGETKVQAVAGDSIDDAVFRKVDAPNPDYKLTKKKSTSANWV